MSEEKTPPEAPQPTSASGAPATAASEAASTAPTPDAVAAAAAAFLRIAAAAPHSDVSPDAEAPRPGPAAQDELTPPAPAAKEEAAPEAVSAYQRIVGACGAEAPADDAAPDAQFSYWSYPSFDASLVEDAEKAEAVAAPATADEGGKKAGKAKKKKGRKPKMRIAHQTAGRVRLKISGAKGNEELLDDIAATFRAIPGIERTTINPVTGSIVLYYDERYQASMNDHLMRSAGPDRSQMFGSEFDELTRKIENQAEFLAERSEMARAVVTFMKSLDREIKISSHNTIDLKIVLATGLIGLTVLELGANAATPVWLTLSVFTFNHFLELHTPRMPLEQQAGA
jgi:hypothetical protein